MMDRRAFLAGSVTLLAAPLATEAQQAGTKVPHIGYLSNSTGRSVPDTAFMEGLRDLGYVDGRNIAIEGRYTSGNSARFTDFAAELVRLRVDIIVGWSPWAVGAAKQVTSTTPIVGISMGDPVSVGWAASLSRPGGNVTGLTELGIELSGKRLELLREAFPRLGRAAVLGNPTQPFTPILFNSTISAARSLGLEIEVFNADSPKALEAALAGIEKRKSEALVVLPDGMLWAFRRQIVELVAKQRLPAIYWAADYVDVGGLMSYGTSLPDLGRRAATYVDKILKGSSPGDLPIEQPTKFELVINLKTAKALGLTLPQSLMRRADHVIE